MIKKYKQLTVVRKIVTWALMFALVLLGCKLIGIHLQLALIMMFVGIGLMVIGLFWGDQF